MEKQKVHRSVSTWLLIGLVMVFLQVVIGGVTRLTDSGLSITEWEVIQGTLPPMNATQWEEAFQKYKVKAGKQFMSLHADMDMAEFQFIYFWEYFHRLWARIMGLVFIIPFGIFLYQKKLPRWLLPRLGGIILLAAAAAVFGWIMVASGLDNDQRTWVSAYKLIIHLSIATALFGYIFWTWQRSRGVHAAVTLPPYLYRLVWGGTVFLLFQIVLGGLMAGMRAGLVHPHFPMFVNGSAFFASLKDATSLTTDTLIDYEASASVKSWVQLFHRIGAYLITAWVVLLFARLRKWPALNTSAWLMLSLVLVQFLLGVLTVISCIGRVPLFYGAAHQAVALLLWISMLSIGLRIKK